MMTKISKSLLKGANEALAHAKREKTAAKEHKVVVPKNIIESYKSVWDAIADTPGEAANLRAKAELMRKLITIIQSQKWTQAETAKHCGITQPRLNDMLRGRMSRFSLDALVNIAAALGQQVHIRLQAA
jgi:predicted XRE-type DNA-binding protein